MMNKAIVVEVSGQIRAEPAMPLLTCPPPLVQLL